MFPSLEYVATRVPVSPGSSDRLVFESEEEHFFNSGTNRLNSSVSEALPLGFWSLVTTPSISQQYLSLSLPSGTSKVIVTHSEEPLSKVTVSGSTLIDILLSDLHPDPLLGSTVNWIVSCTLPVFSTSTSHSMVDCPFQVGFTGASIVRSTANTAEPAPSPAVVSTS